MAWPALGATCPPRGRSSGGSARVFDQGIRRPGYPANEWAEGWIADRFRSIGLDNVRLEPITVTQLADRLVA